MKHKIKKILKRFVPVVLVALLLGILIYNVNAKLLLGNQLPMPLGVGVSVVLSGSMEPTFSKDDVIIVKPTDDIYVDQIVVYQDGDSMTVHRIVEINGDKVITQGDANESPDSPINVSAIKGEVVFMIPSMGVVVKLFQQPLVIVLMLALAIVLFEGSFRKEKSRRRDELDELREEIKRLTDSGVEASDSKNAENNMDNSDK